MECTLPVHATKMHAMSNEQSHAEWHLHQLNQCLSNILQVLVLLFALAAIVFSALGMVKLDRQPVQSLDVHATSFLNYSSSMLSSVDTLVTRIQGLVPGMDDLDTMLKKDVNLTGIESDLEVGQHART